MIYVHVYCIINYAVTGFGEASSGRLIWVCMCTSNALTEGSTWLQRWQVVFHIQVALRASCRASRVLLTDGGECISDRGDAIGCGIGERL